VLVTLQNCVCALLGYRSCWYYAFPKAFQVSPDVAGPPYVTSRLFPFRTFPFLSAFVKHEVKCFVSLWGAKQILQQQSYFNTWISYSRAAERFRCSGMCSLVVRRESPNTSTDGSAIRRYVTAGTAHPTTEHHIPNAWNLVLFFSFGYCSVPLRHYRHYFSKLENLRIKFISNILFFLILPAAAHLLRSWVRIPPGAWIFVCCECRVLLGRGLCDELITRPEESYRLWCVVVCDLETWRIGAPYIYIYMTLVA
jgi:hypothetical protein